MSQLITRECFVMLDRLSVETKKKPSKCSKSQQTERKIRYKHEENSQNASPNCSSFPINGKSKFAVTLNYAKYGGNKPFQCTYCQAKFKMAQQLIEHVERMHGRRDASNPDVIILDESPERPSQVATSGCTKKELWAESDENNTKESYDSHEYDESDDVDVENFSEDCDDTLSENVPAIGRNFTPRNPREGVVVKKGGSKERKSRAASYGCKICKQQFKYLGLLRIHERQHAGDKPFGCSTCGKRFLQSFALKAHEKVHVSSKREVLGLKLITPQQHDRMELPRESLEEDHSQENSKTERLRRKCSFVADYAEIEDDWEKESEDEGNQKEEWSWNKGGKNTGEKPFSCSDCGKSFLLLGDLESHEIIHTRKQLLKCEICDKTFPLLRQLIYHRKQHEVTLSEETVLYEDYGQVESSNHSENEVEGEKIPSNPVLTEQDVPDILENLNCNEDETSLTCDVCNKMFRQSYRLKIHQRIHSGDLRYECDICDKRFTHQGALSCHRRRHKKESARNRTSVASQEVAGTASPEKPNFVSGEEVGQERAETIPTERSSERFNEPHREPEPTAKMPHHQCQVCYKLLTTNFNLKRHAAEVHLKPKCTAEKPFKHHAGVHRSKPTAKKPFQCGVCDMLFKLKHHLTDHETVHSDERPHACSVCSKGFKLKRELKRHVRSVHKHSVEKLVCRVCDKLFKDKNQLTRHEVVHSDVRPYKCDVCNFAFKWRYNLKKHGRVHSDDRPYACDVCNQGFRWKEGLLRHQKVHQAAEQNPAESNFQDLVISDVYTIDLPTFMSEDL